MASCGTLNPAQQQTAIATINAMATQGTISQQEAQDMIARLTSGGGTPLWASGVQVFLSALLGYLGVRYAHGNGLNAAAQVAQALQQQSAANVAAAIKP